MRLLLVDPSDRQRRFLGWLLREFRGLDVSEAVNGATALSMLQNDPFDLLILEPQLTDMDGLALLGAALDAEGMPSRVLILSRALDEVYKRKARSLGVQAYLTKPTAAVCVRDTVRDLLAWPETPVPPGAEKRRSARLNVPATVALQLRTPALYTTADIGLFGAFVMTDKPLPCDTEGSLALSLPHLEEPLFLRFRVVHARARAVVSCLRASGCDF